MTVYGWDQSHYDGRITNAIMSSAKSQGISFVTHKVGEGTGGKDYEASYALAAAKAVGIEFIGGYHVVRSGSVTPQVDAFINLTNAAAPWWKTFPGWFWQVDLERWPYDNVAASTGIAFAKQLRQRTGRLVVLYASHGQYGGELSSWDGPLWNADYASGSGGFKALYPGDNWTPLHGSWRGGWTAYSGKVPTFLQYSSKATIGGLTTCDANAFRGTVDDLRTLITGDNMPTAEEIAQAVWTFDIVGWGPNPKHYSANGSQLDTAFRTAAITNTQLPAMDSKLDLIMAAVAALGGSNVDTQSIIDAVNAAAAAGSAERDALLAKIAELEADIADRDRRLAEAYNPPAA